jgi:hypothetical protein
VGRKLGIYYYYYDFVDEGMKFFFCQNKNHHPYQGRKM